MTLKECYQLLGVESSTTLEDVKRAYRRRAFELHPDLNPHLADAGRQFQQLNEAYVILSRLIAAREARDERLKGRPGFKKSAESGTEQRAPGPGAADASATHDATARSSQKNAGQNTQTGPTTDTASGKTASSAAQSGQQAQAGEKREAKREERETSHSTYGSAASGAKDSGAASSSATDARQAEKERTGRAASENLYTEQQEVLRDILNDPFARRVFEDIYSEIRKKGAPPPEPPRKAPAPKPRKSFADILNLNWGQHKSSVHFSHGVGGAVKDWLRNQIDEEQTFHLPAARLFPGARIRLQIRHGLSDNVTTLEVTLPPDFAVGKPIRLKGMGKKLGRWQGDLYLRLMAGN